MPAKGWRKQERKCKYCDRPAKINMRSGGRHKGYYRTCGSSECLRKQYDDSGVCEAKRHVGKKHPFWHPIGSIRKSGDYMEVKISDSGTTKENWRRQHEITAEQILGRSLVEGEEVHHIDCDKCNNSPGNIYVYASSGKHIAGHGSLNRALKALMTNGTIIFNGNIYELSDI